MCAWDKSFIGLCCFVLFNLFLCKGSPVGSVKALTDLNLPGSNATQDAVPARITSSLTRPVQPTGPWPSTITLDSTQGVYLTIDSVYRLTDPAQIEDMARSLASLRATICVPGHNPSSVFAPHTHTTLVLNCPLVGLPLMYQQHMLDVAVTHLSLGQVTYGAAAVGSSIFGSFGPGREDLEFGGLVYAIVPTIPPTAKHAWPATSLTIDVSGWETQGQRLRILSRGPTLDNWDRAWYIWLCLEAQMGIRSGGRLHDPVEAMKIELPSQRLEFKFRPFVKGKGTPSRVMLLNVITAVSDQVIQPYGARDLEFQWIDEGGRHLGVGYLEWTNYGGVGMEPIAMSGNRTAQRTDVRGMNGTRPILDLRGSNTTGNSESVITA